MAICRWRQFITDKTYTVGGMLPTGNAPNNTNEINPPYNSDSYLLISAGRDTQYMSGDDNLNFSNNVQ